jgi:hypothetical protein
VGRGSVINLGVKVRVVVATAGDVGRVELWCVILFANVVGGVAVLTVMVLVEGSKLGA